LYNYTNNDIQQILSERDTLGVSKLTYVNIGRKSNLGLTASYNISLSKVTHAYMSGTLRHVKLESFVENERVANIGWMGDFNFGLNYSPAKSVQLTGRFSYTSPDIYLLGKVNNYPYYILSGSKRLLSDRLSISASIVNPFKKFQYVKNTYSGLDFEQTMTRQVYNRSCMFTASYKIGKLKGQIKRSNKSISNSDELSVKQ
jgi:hypothetical protein